MRLSPEQGFFNRGFIVIILNDSNTEQPLGGAGPRHNRVNADLDDPRVALKHQPRDDMIRLTARIS